MLYSHRSHGLDGRIMADTPTPPNPRPSQPAQPPRPPREGARPERRAGGGRPNGKGRPSAGPQRQEPRLPDDPLVGKILHLAQEVHAELGAGLPPKFYREIFTTRLQKLGVATQLKPRGVLKHRDKVAAEFTPDFLCETSLVIDIHDGPQEFSQAQIAQTSGAMKFYNARFGILLDFTRPELVTRLLSPNHGTFPTIPHEEILHQNPVEKHDELRASMLARSLLRVGRAQGLGYGQEVYRGLLRVEFNLEAIDYEDEPTASIMLDGITLGECALTQIMTFQRSGALLILSQQDGIRATDKQRLKAALRYLKLPWGLIAHFSRKRFEWQWVKA